MKARKREKETHVAEKTQGTAPCPFCGEGELVPWPSGQHALCRKCNHIVRSPQPRAFGSLTGSTQQWPLAIRIPSGLIRSLHPAGIQGVCGNNRAVNTRLGNGKSDR